MQEKIHNGCSVRIENSATRVTIRHYSASFVMPNSYPRDEMFNPHITHMKDSYSTLYSFVIIHISNWSEKINLLIIFRNL